MRAPLRLGLVCRLAGLAVLTLCAFGTDALAQAGGGVSQRPYKAIFGGSDTTASQDGGLDVTVTLAQAYDDDVTGRSGSRPSAQTQQTVGGYFSMGTIAAEFDRPGDHLSVAANGLAGGSYYPDMSDLSGFQYSGAASLGVAFGGFRADLVQTAAVRPYYSFVATPLVADPGQLLDPTHAFGADLVREDTREYQSRATLRQELTARTAVSGTAGWRKTRFPGGAGDLTHVLGAVRLERKFTKYLTLVAGYGQQEGRYESRAQTFTTRDITVGTDYNRPLSRTRRTFVSASTGTTSVEDQTGRRLRVTGSAGLRHQMGRTWSANLQYARDAQYVQGFSAPFLSDGVTGVADGFLSRRAHLKLQTGYSTGVIGLTTDAPGYETIFGTMEMRYALTRIVALQAQYLYYDYTFDRDASLVGLPRQMQRNGVRIGVTFWLPLL